MSLEQRDKRTTILDQRVGDSNRGQGERTPTYRGELLHYRDDYGTSMDDTRYEATDEAQQKFLTQVDTSEAAVQKSKDEASSMYNKQLSSINSQEFSADPFSVQSFSAPSYDQLVENAKASGELVSVKVFDKGAYVSEHWLGVDDANNYVNSMQNSGIGKGWNDEGRLGVDIMGYGKEFHHPLIDAETDSRNTYAQQVEYAQSEYNAEVAQAQSAYDTQYSQASEAFDISKSSAISSLDSEYSGVQAQIGSQEAQIESMIKANNNSLNEIRNKYSQKMGSVKNTIAEMFNAKNKG